MKIVPDEFFSTLSIISSLLEKNKYALRGTAGLHLQNIEMNIKDIDIVCDEATAISCNILLKDYLKEEIKYSETEKYKSFFGKFNINNTLVEVYGNWQIKNSKGVWSRVFDASERSLVKLDTFEIYVTLISVELEMYAYMERWSVFHMIKKAYKKDPMVEAFVKEDNSKQLGLFS